MEDGGRGGALLLPTLTLILHKSSVAPFTTLFLIIPHIIRRLLLPLPSAICLLEIAPGCKFHCNVAERRRKQVQRVQVGGCRASALPGRWLAARAEG